MFDPDFHPSDLLGWALPIDVARIDAFTRDLGRRLREDALEIAKRDGRTLVTEWDALAAMAVHFPPPESH